MVRESRGRHGCEAVVPLLLSHHIETEESYQLVSF